MMIALTNCHERTLAQPSSPAAVHGPAAQERLQAGWWPRARGAPPTGVLPMSRPPLDLPFAGAKSASAERSYSASYWNDPRASPSP
jgi:hypothetical protein